MGNFTQFLKTTSDWKALESFR